MVVYDSKLMFANTVATTYIFMPSKEILFFMRDF